MNRRVANLDDEARVALEKRVALFRGKEQKGLASLTAAAGTGDRERAQLQLDVMMAYADLREEAEALLAAATGDDEGLTYLVGSLFLHDCYKELVSGPDERMHYVTGLKLGTVLTMDRIISFALDAATPVFAQGNLASSHQALMRLTRFGHRLHGLFHSHPGRGKEATHPSHIDLDTQERQECGRYPVVGAIFSRDGFVRFFSVRNRFSIVTYGEGIEHVGETVYRLTELGDNPAPDRGGVDRVGETVYRLAEIA
jgi:hypothetical protein